MDSKVMRAVQFLNYQPATKVALRPSRYLDASFPAPYFHTSCPAPPLLFPGSPVSLNREQLFGLADLGRLRT